MDYQPMPQQVMAMFYISSTNVPATFFKVSSEIRSNANFSV